MPPFNRVTIVGLGLIGGSLGIAVKRRHVAKTVVGFSRTAATLRRARRGGAIDVGTMNAQHAVCDADLVVIATPVDTVVAQAKRLARFMRPGSVLTDVGSTKAFIVSELERTLPRGIAFVGGHPLAGSEQRGLDAANARLFDGSICVLTPTAETDPQALKRVIRFWKPLVRRVVTMSPAQHDRLLAATSHLPHALACCLVQAVPAGPLPQAPRSFLDMTRIAKSDPGLWGAILFTNRKNLLEQMQRFDTQWRRLRRRLSRRDRAGVWALLGAAQRRRNAMEPRER